MSGETLFTVYTGASNTGSGRYGAGMAFTMGLRPWLQVVRHESLAFLVGGVAISARLLLAVDASSTHEVATRGAACMTAQRLILAHLPCNQLWMDNSARAWRVRCLSLQIPIPDAASSHGMDLVEAI